MVEKIKSYKQLNALTSLRFFAAVHVVLYHLYSNGYLSFYFNGPFHVDVADYFLLSYLENGYSSVSLFFTLSGFILVYAYQDRPLIAFDDRMKFYISRVSRIYPVYLGALLLIAPLIIFLVVIGQKSTTNALVGLFLNLLLIQAWIAPSALSWNAPGWSLSVECFFYLCFPYIYKKIRDFESSKLIYVALMVYMIGLLIPVLYIIYSPDGVAYDALPHAYFSQAPLLVTLKFLPFLRVHEFFIGIVAGLIYLKKSVNFKKWVFDCITLFLCVLYFLILVYSRPRFFPLLHNGVLSPLFAMLIFAIANGNLNDFVKFNSPIELLGRASFSLYLIHSPILLIWIRAWGGSNSIESGMYSFGIVFVFSVLLSVVFFKCIEEPLRIFLQKHIWCLFLYISKLNGKSRKYL